jgi:hypothetical protein
MCGYRTQRLPFGAKVSKTTSQRRLRLPVHFVSGHWEFMLGGGVPIVDGAEAEIILNRKHVSDPIFLRNLDKNGKHRLLREGARLLVGLKIKDGFAPSDALKRTVSPVKINDKNVKISISNSEFHAINTFVEVYIAPPDDTQARILDTQEGGLWLLTTGIEATGLESTNIKLPPGVEPKVVKSLNHAYTRLSEIFETWRTSHTGNIYQRILYEEKNGNWYPLELLRNRALQRAEHEFAQEHWMVFLASMTKASST